MLKLARILILILLSSVFLNIPLAETQKNDNQYSNTNDSFDVAFDGIISPNEYYSVLNLGSNFKLHYMLNDSKIFLAMESDVGGYVSIGLGGDGMSGADIYIGYYDTSAHIQDNWGKSSVAHSQDAIQNILNFGGSDDGTTTIIEFSRYLVTGDTSEDIIIPLDTDIPSVYATHSTNDDFTSTHDTRARVTINFATYIPSNPVSLVGSPSDGEGQLNWNPPNSDGGQAISYNVYRSSTSGSAYSLIGTTTANSYTDTTVTNGEVYYYVVSTTNAKGESPYSNEVSITPSGQIGEPQNVQGDSGDGFTSINWTIPATDGGSPITGYNIYRSTESQGDFTLISTTSSLDYTDNDVINGFTYYYKITAVNALSEGVASNELSLTPKGVSTVPLNLGGFADSTSVTLSWDDPVSFGGYDLINYAVYRRKIEDSTFSLIGSNTSANTYYDTNVTNKQIYVYYITLNNTFAESAPSDNFQIIVAQVPYQITNITIFPSYLNLTIIWQAPFDNSFTIEMYSVYRSEKQDLTDELFITNTTELFYNDLSVSNGIPYYYRILAINSQGEGPLSSPISSIAGVIPDTPNKFKGTISDDSIFLEWKEPDSDGGSAINTFKVYRISQGENESVIFDGLKYNITDDTLTEGIDYNYSVTAVNDVGESVRSTITLRAGTVPGQPDAPTITLFNNYVKLEWSDPENGGFDIINFNVYRTSISGKSYTYLGSERNEFSDVNLIKGATFYYVISAVNLRGESAYSFESNVTIPFDASPPRNLASLGGDNIIGLSWSAPLIGAEDINEYNIYKSDTENGTFEMVGNTTITTFVDYNVTNNSTYYYYVVGLTDLGEGPHSEIVSATPLKIIVTTDITTTLQENNTQSGIMEYQELILTVSLFLSIGMIGSTFLILRKLKK